MVWIRLGDETKEVLQCKTILFVNTNKIEIKRFSLCLHSRHIYPMHESAMFEAVLVSLGCHLCLYFNPGCGCNSLSRY